MVKIVADPMDLPLDSHALSFYADAAEAEDHAVRFLAGAAPGAPAVYFVPDEATSERYNARLSSELPERVGCVIPLVGHCQVETVEGKLRPVREVRDFVAAHTEGVTAGGDTLSMYLLPNSVSDHIEYESWFDRQPREHSRFVCPYDLRRVPVDSAPEFLRELGEHHSHIVLSSSAEPAVRLLQLFTFGTRATVPEPLHEDLDWAVDQGYLEVAGPDSPLRLTPHGRDVVREWSDRTTVDW